VACAVSVGCATLESSATPGIVTAKELRIVDGLGNPRVIVGSDDTKYGLLGVDPAGMSIRLLDQSGRIRLRLLVNNETGAISFQDGEGEERLWIGENSDGGWGLNED
jgi:hypothetical protein